MSRQSYSAGERGGTGRPEEHEIEVTRHEAALPGLPERLNGTTLVQISDLHRGNAASDSLIRAAVEAANALEADYALATGDFVDARVRDILPAVELVSGLRARRGRFAVLGNHDHRADAPMLAAALEAAGFTVLDNCGLQIAGGLWLAGVDDLYEGNGDLRATMSGLPDAGAAILLSHNPSAFDEVDSRRPLLILSGHTHGGQIRIRFPTPEMICWRHLRTRLVQGWFERGQVRLYVNRGIGVAGPWPFNRRVNCRPEVSCFRLVSAPWPGASR